MSTEPRASSCTEPRARGVRGAFVAATFGAGLLLASCGPPPALLEPLFPEAVNPANATKPFVGRVRRVPPKREQEEFIVVTKLPERPDLAAILETLPHGDDGQVKWMEALADKLIAPRPGIADDVKDEEPTDIDVELVPKDQPEMKVVFSHKVHTSWLGCPACHSGLFEMERGKTVITMDKINAGASCGTCHGKVAAPEPMTCPACHKAMG